MTKSPKRSRRGKKERKDRLTLEVGDMTYVVAGKMIDGWFSDDRFEAALDYSEILQTFPRSSGTMTIQFRYDASDAVVELRAKGARK